MRESNIKFAITERLQIYENQGKIIWWERLNSGEVIVLRGKKPYRVKLCREGTPDFIVIRQLDPQTMIPEVIFLEAKSDTGELSEAQEVFQQRMVGNGIGYYVVRSAQEVIDIIGVDVDC